MVCDDYMAEEINVKIVGLFLWLEECGKVLTGVVACRCARARNQSYVYFFRSIGSVNIMFISLTGWFNLNHPIRRNRRDNIVFSILTRLCNQDQFSGVIEVTTSCLAALCVYVIRTSFW